MKGQNQMMWIIIAAVLALLVLVIYSFMTGGIVRKFTETIFGITDETNSQFECTVLPWASGDTNGDGIKDTEECKKYAPQNIP